MSTTRPDFSIKLGLTQSSYATSNGIGSYSSWMAAASSHSESQTGTTRHKPQGFINPTAYTFKRVQINAAQGQCLNQPTVNPSGVSGQLWKGVVGQLPGEPAARFLQSDHFNGAISEASAESDQGLRDTALTAARNNLKNSKVNLGQAYGERNQTARLLGDTATRLASSFRNLKRGRVRRAMDDLGISSKKREPRGSNAPNKWLELQYGWKPLCSDVFGAADALSKRSGSDWRVTARATKGTVKKYTYTKVGVPGYSNPDACTVVAQVNRSVFCRLDVVPENGAIISLASLGILNPLYVAWELVPYSFVVDWFWPVGSYLSSLDALWGYTQKAYSSSLLVRANWTDTGDSVINPDGKKIVNNYLGTKALVYLSREVGTSIPLPSVPRFKDPWSFGHMANGLALLAGAFGRR